MSFQAGCFEGVLFQAAGQSGYTTLQITSYDWAEEVEKLIATNSTSNGIQAVIAGVLSGDCTVEAIVDAAALPNTGVNPIRSGVKGLIKVQVGSTNPFIIPCMIQKVNDKSSMSTLVTYNFTVTLDSLSGAYVLPS